MQGGCARTRDVTATASVLALVVLALGGTGTGPASSPAVASVTRATLASLPPAAQATIGAASARFRTRRSPDGYRLHGGGVTRGSARTGSA